VSTAIVDSVIRLRGLPPKAHEILWRGLTFPNPEYVSRVRFDRWVGATPEEITLVDRGPDGSVIVPRGAVGMVRGAIAAVGGRVNFTDRRVVLAPVAYASDLRLREYQAPAVEDLVRQVQGFIVGPCGSGKTVCGIAAIARTGQPAIILVHTYDLLEQWRGAIRHGLGIEAGTIAGGTASPEVVTVAMVQTLAQMPSEDLETLGRRFGCVVIDELHHVPAATFRSVLSRFPGRFRLGLTATPTREDGLTPLLELCVGPCAHTIRHCDLVAAGHLVLPTIVPIATGCAPGGDTHTRFVSKLTLDPGRNRVILDLARREAQAGRSVLVLSGRVEHCGRLAAALCSEGVDAAALTAKVPRKLRSDILERFRSGDLPVVCATTLADEGLDVTRLGALVLATPARAEGRTVQRLGRLMRPHDEKGTPVLYDLVDATDLAKRQFGARKRAYRKVLGVDACIPEPMEAAEVLQGHVREGVA
jgi:superfamily II DNA or RNA helicase